MKYFVTGGTGFIGGHLVKKLSDSGLSVAALARNPERATQLASLPNVTLVKGDVGDKESMREGMTGVDGVFHVAGWFKVGANKKEREQGQAVNVVGTRNVLELAKELQIAKIVYTSTLAINSDTKGVLVDETYEFEGAHQTEYDRTKWEAHAKVAVPMMNEGLPLVIVMPGMVYGMGDTGDIHGMFVRYLTQKLPATPKGTTYCFGRVEDTVEGHILAMDKGKIGESYIIAGEVVPIMKCFEIAEKITGVKAPGLHPSGGMLRITAAALSPIAALVDLPADMQPEMLRSLASTYIGSNAKAREQLGYNPQPLEEGLREYLPALQAELQQKSAGGPSS